MAHYCAKTEQNTLSTTAADGFTEHYIIRLLSACEPPTTNVPSPTALVLSVVNEINNLKIVFKIFQQGLQLLQSLQSIRRQSLGLNSSSLASSSTSNPRFQPIHLLLNGAILSYTLVTMANMHYVHHYKSNLVIPSWHVCE